MPIGAFRRSSLLFAMVFLFAACDAANVSPREGRADSNARQFSVHSEELQNHETPGFVFLLPTAASPAGYGDLVSDLPVTVRVDELSETGKASRTLATFTKDSGPERERLRIHHEGRPCDADDDDGDTDSRGYYYVRWFIDDANLASSARYRVRVLVPGKVGHPVELGYTDVDIATTSRMFRSVDSKRFVPLLNGNTLRVRFRAGWQAVDRDHDGIYDWLDDCPNTANHDQKDSLDNGIGDACRCDHVFCPPLDLCHMRGICQPETGTCTNPLAPDGKACPMAHADARCAVGVCQLISCNPAYADCNGNSADGCEISTKTNQNCGGCEIPCLDGPNSKSTCHSGQCQLKCSRGHADCDADPTNGCEQNIGSDSNNCGVCVRVCPNDQGCVNGVCSAAICPSNYADCDGDKSNGCEVNIETDVNHCGNCGNVCSFPNATAACSAGSCALATCNTGYVDCNGIANDGCETDITNDLNNCGGCNYPCAPVGSTPFCNAGACTIAGCQAGHVDCDGQLDNGCEVILSSDANNCGACGYACVVSNAVPLCASGSCEVGSCNSGYADCNGQVQDGCEARLPTDVVNCGECGTVCAAAPNALPTCESGICGLSCNSGYADCDNNPSNGCETDVQGNCGTCDGSCSVPHAMGECFDGVCSFSVCEVGYADCDGIATNGCEVNLNSDSGNCGGCSNVCTSPNGTVACVGGACTHTACPSGYGDCDGDVSNGCEASLNSVSQCGSCTKTCAANGLCMNGACVCNFGMPPCSDNTCPDYSSDPRNCGRCGHVCSAPSSSCSNYLCTCIPGSMRCGSSGMPRCCWYPDDICGGGQCFSRHPDHCGMNDGVQCAPGEICGRSVPGAVYDYECLTLDNNTDPNNCGAIGKVCATGQDCVGGVCSLGY